VVKSGSGCAASMCQRCDTQAGRHLKGGTEGKRGGAEVTVGWWMGLVESGGSTRQWRGACSQATGEGGLYGCWGGSGSWGWGVGAARRTARHFVVLSKQL
jgi:hypothetical protein